MPPPKSTIRISKFAIGSNPIKGLLNAFGRTQSDATKNAKDANKIIDSINEKFSGMGDIAIKQQYGKLIDKFQNNPRDLDVLKDLSKAVQGHKTHQQHEMEVHNKKTPKQLSEEGYRKLVAKIETNEERNHPDYTPGKVLPPKSTPPVKAQGGKGRGL